MKSANFSLDLFRIKSPDNERAQRRSLCVKAIKCMVPLLAYLKYHSLVKQICQRNRKQNERNNKNKAFKPQSNANHHRRNDNSNWWSFGKSADKWNKALNPEFSTLFQGHLLDENVNVLHNDNDNEEYDEADSGYDEWVNKVSLLGPSTSHPPGIGML